MKHLNQVFIALVMSLWLFAEHSHALDRKKRYKQDILDSSDNGNVNQEADDQQGLDFNNENEGCLRCRKTEARISFTNTALVYFWRGDYNQALACACQQLKSSPSDEQSRSILASLYHHPEAKRIRSLYSIPAPSSMSKNNNKKDNNNNNHILIKNWEILGPINVGKLELDADSTFPVHGLASDVAAYILSMPSNLTIHSELVTEGKTSWKKFTPANPGQLDISFHQLPWNNIAQGLSTAAAYEYQGWIRATGIVKSSGQYAVDCQGMHSLYLWNDFSTRTLAGDVYRSGQFQSHVDLKAGIVGIVIPIRAVLQSQLFVSISPAPLNVIVSAPQHVPHLLQLKGNSNSKDKGLLLSGLFMLPLTNPFAQTVSIDFDVTFTSNEQQRFFLRHATHGSNNSRNSNSNNFMSITIAPGQSLALPLELIPASNFNNKNSNDGKLSSAAVFLPCRGAANSKGAVFTINITPSKGGPVSVMLSLECRRSDQSFHFSFLSHDSSVATAAVVLPKDYHSQNTLHKVKEVCVIGESGQQCEERDEASYPALLTLHGSGISPLQHADAYKMKPPSFKEKDDYLFGVDGFYIVAPSRFGAHNWEGVGDLTARSSLTALQAAISRIAERLLPSLSLEKNQGIVMGHSMGGHGAWVLATNSPDRFLCALPTAGWIRKEEYGNSNLFFSLDSSSSFTDPALKVILEIAMGEYHVDRVVSNLRTMSNVHVRVGSDDQTTHSWFSRRMVRLLQQQLAENGQGDHSNQQLVVLEEVAAKQHWWWDSIAANDGGVLNDQKLRKVYSACRDKGEVQAQLYRDYRRFSTLASPVSLSFSEWQIQLNQQDLQVEESGIIGDGKRARHACDVNEVSLSTLNPSLHEGLCGLKVMQQKKSMLMSTIDVKCSIVNVNEEDGSSGNKRRRNCAVQTRNVRKMILDFSFGSILFDDRNNRQIAVNGYRFVIPQSPSTTVDVCIAEDRQPSVCQSLGSIDLLQEKNLVNAGPIRLVYDRPLVIVHGTPSLPGLRQAMRDLSVYIANSLYTSHSTFVSVLSDLDYLSSPQYNSNSYNSGHNIIFIGDILNNKLLKLVLGDDNSTSAQSNNNKKKGTGEGIGVKITGKLPGGISFRRVVSETVSSNEEEEEWTSTKKEDTFAFTFANRSFNQLDQAIMFTMPLATGSTRSQQVAMMGVVISGNSAAAYSHLSRLAWPVIPPMVRAPFANYMPDFVVIDSRLWALGPGAFLAAGFWSYDWQIDHSQAFVQEIIF